MEHSAIFFLRVLRGSMALGTYSEYNLYGILHLSSTCTSAAYSIDFHVSRHTYSIPNLYLFPYTNRVPQPWEFRGWLFPHRTSFKIHAIAAHQLHCFFPHRRRWGDHCVNRHTQSQFRVRQKGNAPYICPWLASKSRWQIEDRKSSHVHSVLDTRPLITGWSLG